MVDYLNLIKMGGFGDLVIMTSFIEPIKKIGKTPRFIVSTDYEDIMLILDVDYIAIHPSNFWAESQQHGGIILTYPEFWQKSFIPLADYTHILDRWAGQLGLPKYNYSPCIKNPYVKRRLVTYQTDAGWSPYKEWRRFSELIGILKTHYPIYEFKNICENKSFKTTLQEISESDLFIGIDSVGQHIAKAVGTKSIIIWGSTPSEMFGYESNVNIIKKLPCQPCFREYAQIDTIDDCVSEMTGKCMVDITVYEVLQKVTQELVYAS